MAVWREWSAASPEPALPDLGAWWAVRNLDLQLNTKANDEGMDSEFEVSWKIAPRKISMS